MSADLASSHPILSCAEAGAWERRLLQDEAAEWAAMERAGAAIARSVVDDFKEIGGMPDDARMLILVGKGHNGGDALLAARELLTTRPSAHADVAMFFGEAALRPLARRSLEALRQTAAGRVAIAPAASLLDTQESYALCLDGIFGFQFRPPMDSATAAMLDRVNANQRITFRAAIDLPSGVGEGDNRGEAAFKADFTYAPGILKMAAIEPMNADVLGRVRYLDLGFFSKDEPESKVRVLLPSILRQVAQLRPAQTDKRTYGHLFVVGGSRNFPGAVLMAAQAALRSGVGLLTAFVPVSLVPEYSARFPEVMWTGWPETEGGGLATAGVPRFLEQISRASALVIGPGLGAEAETLATAREVVRGTTCPMLIDADALRPEVLGSANGKPVVLTPHAGEFQRILGEPSWREGAALVLKGSPTRVSKKGESLCHSFFGGPVLARGGSGDVLAGLTAGLLAQNPGDLLLAACRGVVWHGLAADLLARDRGQVAVQTTQLFDYLQSALHQSL